MNPRIKELWDKAAESAAAYPSGQNNSWETQTKFIDKFAELIVLECATAIIQDSRLNDVRSAANGCVRTIKEHFGVE